MIYWVVTLCGLEAAQEEINFPSSIATLLGLPFNTKDGPDAVLQNVKLSLIYTLTPIVCDQ
jgi:hypothetical protein